MFEQLFVLKVAKEWHTKITQKTIKQWILLATFSRGNEGIVRKKRMNKLCKNTVCTCFYMNIRRSCFVCVLSIEKGAIDFEAPNMSDKCCKPTIYNCI